MSAVDAHLQVGVDEGVPVGHPDRVGLPAEQARRSHGETEPLIRTQNAQSTGSPLVLAPMPP